MANYPTGTHFAGPIKLGPESMLKTTDVGGITARVLTADESNGQCYILDGSGGVTFTLPKPTQGWRCRFTVGKVFASTNYVITAGTTDTFEGSMIVVGAVVDVDAADTITLAASAENVGDFIDFWSDGTSIFVFGNFLVTAAAAGAG